MRGSAECERSAESGPALTLFGPGSRPNSKFQVNNNVWICRNQVQSLPEHSKLGLATRLLLGLLPRFLNTQLGVTVGVPHPVSLLCVKATQNTQGRKIQLTYLKQPEDGEAIPLLKGFVSH